MMHFEQVVVTLVDSNKKPFRELNSQRQDRGRKCEVFAPADSEYKFLIKNNTDKRIKVDIDIDGSCVTAGGLILNAHETDYIERFLDVEKKFKTSLVTGEGVADPTSPENGIIKVRVHKEKSLVIPQPLIQEHHHHHHHHDVWWNRPSIWYDHNQPMYGGVLRGASFDCNSKGLNSPGVTVNEFDTSGYTAKVDTALHYTAQASDVIGSVNSVQCSLSQPAPAPSLATVEGSKSDQKFGTTFWLGDDLEFGELVFTFYLKLQAAVDPEYVKYLELKQKFEGK